MKLDYRLFSAFSQTQQTEGDRRKPGFSVRALCWPRVSVRGTSDAAGRRRRAVSQQATGLAMKGSKRLILLARLFIFMDKSVLIDDKRPQTDIRTGRRPMRGNANCNDVKTVLGVGCFVGENDMK